MWMVGQTEGCWLPVEAIWETTARERVTGGWCPSADKLAVALLARRQYNGRIVGWRVLVLSTY
jgi:hypothetical protein